MKKGKNKGGSDEPADEAATGISLPNGICVAGHPRSARGVRRAKGWGGLCGALLATILAMGAHLPLFDVMLRGLAGGIIGQLVLWAVAIAVARQLVIAEVRARYAELTRAADAAAAASSS
jgi:hypothetical protein